jgi:hypothetical protein
MLGGGEVTADALVSGTPGIGVGVGVVAGGVAVGVAVGGTDVDVAVGNGVGLSEG